MSVSAQRKGWNEAMRSASGTAAMPPALQPRTHKRRSDRRKKQDRRDKARKVSVIGGPESKEFLAAAWLDALEGVTNTGGAGVDGGDDDSYDELDEIDEKSKKRGRGGGQKTKKQQDTGSLPKRFKPRSMANILLEEVNRDDGVAYNWLENEARYNINNNNNNNGNGKSQQIILPARKFCPVTGMKGIYTEPKSGLPYANLNALEQVRERTPPWMNLSGSIIAYNEAVKSIRDEES
jgi:hypothetical protein